MLPKQKNRKRRWLIGVCLSLAAAGLFARQLNSWQRYDGEAKAVTINWQQPDALIRSAHLSRLPRDLLTVPLLKELLDEQFVFYYEGNADRLGLAGTLRRIAYEHDLKWPERLIAEVLDEPAEVALWRDDKGALRRFALVVRRSTLAKVVEQAATVALKDKQLKLAGTLQAGGEEIKVLSLAYANRRTLLFASHGERAVVLSEPGMLLNADSAVDAGAAAAVTALLTAEPQAETFLTQQFAGLKLPESGHQLMLGANVLSFGYQHFFPGVEALRFDFDAAQWSTHLRLNADQFTADALNPSELWPALPHTPAACALLPVDWQQVEAALDERLVKVLGRNSKLAAAFGDKPNPATVCWYRNGRFATPLFATRLSAPPEAAIAEQLQALFEWSAPGGGKIDKTQHKDSVQWTREAQFSGHSEGEAGAKTKVALALAKQYLLFSPDARLVERAIATIERRHPNLLETLPENIRSTTIATLNPKALSTMVKQEAEQTLRDEPVLAQAVTRHLSPKLDKVAKYEPFALVARQMPSAGGAAWVPLTWQTMPSR